MADPQVDPQSVMSGQFNVLPQSTPFQQPQPTGNPMGDATQVLLQQLQGLTPMSTITSQLGDIQNRLQTMPDVQTPQLWQPSLKPVTGAKSLLGDIGNALLLGTGVGRDIVSGVNQRKQQNYENQRQQQLSQLASLKQQQEIPEEQLKARTGISEGIGNLGYKQAVVGVRQQQADTARQRVNDTRDFRNQMIALDTSKLNEQERHNKQDETLRGMGVDVQRDRNNVILSLGDKRISVDATKFDAAQNNKEQGIFDQIGVALGLKQFEGTGAGATPINTTAPALQPNKPAKSNAKASAGKNVAAGTVVYDPAGRAHRADGTAPLPQGWSMTKK